MLVVDPVYNADTGMLTTVGCGNYMNGADRLVSCRRTRNFCWVTCPPSNRTFFFFSVLIWIKSRIDEFLTNFFHGRMWQL